MTWKLGLYQPAFAQQRLGGGGAAAIGQIGGFRIGLIARGIDVCPEPARDLRIEHVAGFGKGGETVGV